MSRYKRYQVIKNDLEYYSKQLDERNVKLIRQYRPKPFGALSDRVLNTLSVQQDVWNINTKLYKLSEQYYGATDFWWVIGYFNNKPTDADWQPGDEILIPQPLSRVLKAVGV